MPAPIIIYDLDGTLAFTEAYWLPLVDILFKNVKEQLGHEPAIQDSREALRFLGRPLEDFLVELFPTAAPEDVQAIYQMETDIWLSDDRPPYVLYEGTLDILARLQQAGFRQFVSSNCQVEYLDGLLNETGLGQFIERGICHGYHPTLEKWQFTGILLEDLDWKTGYFIGDSGSDMKAGRKNGLTTVYASYGYAPRPAEEMIDKEIEDITQLGNVLGIL